MFALGETREIARRNMVLALKELSIRGDIRTTVEYLRKILETNDFRHNNISTTWLEHVMAKREVITEKPDTHLAVLLGALFRAHKSMGAKEKEYLDIMGRGQLPSPQLHSDLVEQTHGPDLREGGPQYTCTHSAKEVTAASRQPATYSGSQSTC